ncbi:MAG: hypothetical protein ACRC1E_06470, partial [Craterilacuibacter sp.]
MLLAFIAVVVLGAGGCALWLFKTGRLTLAWFRSANDRLFGFIYAADTRDDADDWSPRQGALRQEPLITPESALVPPQPAPIVTQAAQPHPEPESRACAAAVEPPLRSQLPQAEIITSLPRHLRKKPLTETAKPRASELPVIGLEDVQYNMAESARRQQRLASIGERHHAPGESLPLIDPLSVRENIRELHPPRAVVKKAPLPLVDVVRPQKAATHPQAHATAAASALSGNMVYAPFRPA